MHTEIESLPEVRAITAQITDLEKFAASYTVTTPEQYAAGADDLRNVKAQQKKLEETRTSLTKPINESLRRLNDFFKAPAEKLAGIERTIKGKLVAYQDEQDRLRREAQRRADEEATAARRKAEAEAAAARAKADAEAAALRAKAEAEAAAGNAAEAAKLAARADTKLEKAEVKAQALETAAAQTVAPIVQAETPKVTGVATRKVWKFEVTDSSKLPREFLMPDEQKIRKYVQAMQADARIDGVRIWSESQIAARGAA